MSSRPTPRTISAAISAVLVVAMPLALPGAAGAQDNRQGGTITVRGEQASYFPTSPEAGVIVVPSVGARAVFDHDRSDDVTTKLPTAGAMKLLGDEESVPAIVRRLDAPDDQDLYAVTLSELTFDPEQGISAVAVLDEAPDRRLGNARADGGVPPVELGAVELVALDGNVRVGGDGGPTAPRSSAKVDDGPAWAITDVYVYVTSNFPAGTLITFKPTDGVCIKDQTAVDLRDQNVPPTTVTLSFTVVSSGNGCWIKPSVANWTVSVQPPGVDEWHRLWLYMTVNQLSPFSVNASCSTINQPKRPTCQGGVTLVGNTVSITMSPGT